jgi:hypothetical protein
MLDYYEKPTYYTVIHMLIGVFTYYYTIIGIIFVIYQFTQLYLNKRFFLFEWKVENGNTLFHTLIKIAEFLVGILSVYKFNALRMNR